MKLIGKKKLVGLCQCTGPLVLMWDTASFCHSMEHPSFTTLFSLDAYPRNKQKCWFLSLCSPSSATVSEDIDEQVENDGIHHLFLLSIMPFLLLARFCHSFLLSIIQSSFSLCIFTAFHTIEKFLLFYWTDFGFNLLEVKNLDLTALNKYKERSVI